MIKKFFDIVMAFINAITTIITNSAVNEFNGTALCGDMVNHLSQINKL